MNEYNDFALFYDIYTDNVGYPKRAQYFNQLINKYNPNAKDLLDLACGTGSLSFELEKYGYDVVAVDNSIEMLNVAYQKKITNNSNVLFLCQDMSNIDLFGTVDVTICALDSINHITDEKVLFNTFKKVSLFSAHDGLFIFDVNTVYKHRYVLGDNSFIFEKSDSFLAWRNGLQDDNLTVDISLNFFKKKNELWERYNIEFSEKAYELSYLKELLEKNDFSILDVFDDDSLLPPKKDSERIVIVARKK